jgi:hypothetical protein
METERAASARPRPLLVVLLAIAVVAFFVTRTDAPLGPPGPPAGPGSGPLPGADATIDPAALDVHLESLAEARPAPSATARNPFRFEARAQAPPPDEGRPAFQELGARGNGLPPAPMSAATRPITVRFIGLLEHRGETFAIFADCTAGRRTSYARAGEIVDGSYRLIRIGTESVVIEHLDGTGRTTLAQTGQECVR